MLVIKRGDRYTFFVDIVWGGSSAVEQLAFNQLAESSNLSRPTRFNVMCDLYHHNCFNCNDSSVGRAGDF